MASSLSGPMNTARKGRLGTLYGARVMAAGLLGFLFAPVLGLGLLCLFAYVHADPHDEQNPGFLFWTEGLNPGYSRIRGSATCFMLTTIGFSLCPSSSSASASGTSCLSQAHPGFSIALLCPMARFPLAMTKR